MYGKTSLPWRGTLPPGGFSGCGCRGEKERSSAVLIVFPEETDEEEIVRYALMAENLAAVRLPVPALDEVNPGKGYIVAEDCGDELLQDVIRTGDPAPLYRQAVDLIVAMQEDVSAAVARLNPPFDEVKFIGELDFFLAHTIEGYCKAGINEDDRAAFRTYFQAVSRGFAHPGSSFSVTGTTTAAISWSGRQAPDRRFPGRPVRPRYLRHGLPSGRPERSTSLAPRDI